MNNSLKNTLIIFSLSGLALFYAMCRRQKITPLHSSDTSPLMVKMLPPFELKTFFPEHSPLTPEALLRDGTQLLVVHFWGTWCPPCLPEFPQLLEFARKFPPESQVKFLLVAVRDSRMAVKKFITKFGLLPSNIIIALDTEGKVMTHFGTVKVPETHYYLKRRSAKRFIGSQGWANPYYSQELRKLLL